MDQALDTVVQENRKQRLANKKRASAKPARGRGGAAARGRGGARAGGVRKAGGAASYNLHDDRTAPVSAPVTVNVGTKLHVSNLDKGVTENDLRELLKKYAGAVKSVQINYGPSGVSRGSADVTMANEAGCTAAIRKLNNAVLDGKAMKIAHVGGHTLEMPASRRPTPQQKRAPVASRGGRGARGGKSAKAKPARKPRTREPKENVSSEQLETQMEQYMNGE